MLFVRFLSLCSAVLLSTGLAFAEFIQTDADYAVIMEAETGQVLFEKQGAAAMIPASMTKIMTVYVVLDRLRSGEIALEDRFTVSENAWRKGGWASGGSTMGLAIGETPTVEELLRGAIVLSGNDACIVLAEGLSGSEAAFAEEMTKTAQRIGLSSAQFKNVSGLYAEGHEISAIDLAKLARATITEFPDYYVYYAEEEMTWNGITQANRNPLLGKIEGADGLKTGHLSVSGFGLVASLEQGGTRRIIVINGLETPADRALEAERMARLAFDAFETRTVTADGAALAELDVWLGDRQAVDIALGEPIAVTAHKRAFEQARTQIVYNAPLEAPIKQGEQIGDLIIEIEGHEPISAPLIASQSVDRLGFIDRAVEGLSRMIAPES